MLTFIYHVRCHDGITALYAATYAADRERLAWEAIPGLYGEPVDLERLRGKDVIFLDFCWPYAKMQEIRAVACSVLVLDHHKTAMDDMAGRPGVGTMLAPVGIKGWLSMVDTLLAPEIPTLMWSVFDMERSGAGIAWDVLCYPEPRPPLVSYVEDRDLWRFALPGSKEVHAACSLEPLTLEARRELMTRSISEMRGEGRTVLRYHDRLVESATRHPAPREVIAGYNVPCIRLPVVELSSDVGAKLAIGEPFAAIRTDTADGRIFYQLRSAPDGLDVGAIAKSLGGGGHRSASGFRIDSKA